MVLKILIADDHDLVRDSLSKYVQMAFPDAEVIGAVDYNSVKAHMEAHNLDMVVCDFVMPGMRGLKTVSQLVADLGNTPLVMISGLASVEDVVAALRLGAKGFLFKTMPPETMIRALQLVASGEIFLPSSLLDTITRNTNTDCGPRGAFAQSPDPDSVIFEQLTLRESEILHHLTEGLSNKEIAKALGVQEITIKVHLKNMYRKLNVSNRTQASNLAFKLGFVSPR